MNYLEFVDRVLRAAASLVVNDYGARDYGVSVMTVAQSLGLSVEGDFWGSPQRMAILRAVDDLDDLALASVSRDFTRIVVTEPGRAAKDDSLQTIWSWLFERWHLDDEERALLRAAVARSEQPGDQFATMTEVTLEEVFGDLGWPMDHARLHSLGRALRDKKCLRGPASEFPLRATYLGVVLATREAQSADQRLLAELLGDWETTTIEVKRELALRSPTQKLEFVRDMLALATTQGRQQRFLVIGFDPKTRAPHANVDAALRQDDLENVLNAHVVGTPPDMSFRTVPWATIQAGLVEVRRDPSVVPYRGAPSIVARFGAAVFIRRLSHIAVATPDDIMALEEEGATARARAGAGPS